MYTFGNISKLDFVIKGSLKKQLIWKIEPKARLTPQTTFMLFKEFKFRTFITQLMTAVLII